MINLRALANFATQTINPNIPVTVFVPNGYTIDPLTREQTPVYVETPGWGNVQALDGDDLKQAEYLNIQGTLRSVYLYGAVAGVIDPDAQPSADLAFSHGGVSGRWSVFKVFETWQNWCKVGVVYQGST